MAPHLMTAAGGDFNNGHGPVWLAVLFVIVWLAGLSWAIRRKVRRRRRLRQRDEESGPGSRPLYAWLYLGGLVVWWGAWTAFIIVMIVKGTATVHGPIVAALMGPLFVSCITTITSARAARWRRAGMPAGPGPRASQAALTGAFVPNAIRDLHARPPESRRRG